MKLNKVFINGGRRGFLVGLDPRDAQRVLAATPVQISIEKFE